MGVLQVAACGVLVLRCFVFSGFRLRCLGFGIAVSRRFGISVFGCPEVESPFFRRCVDVSVSRCPDVVFLRRFAAAAVLRMRCSVVVPRCCCVWALRCFGFSVSRCLGVHVLRARCVFGFAASYRVQRDDGDRRYGFDGIVCARRRVTASLRDD